MSEVKVTLKGDARSAVSAFGEAKKAIRSAKDVVTGLNQGLQLVTASIGHMRKVFGVLTEGASRVDALAKSAEQARMPIESYQAFARVADTFGVSIETATESVKKMSVGISQAAVGTGPAVKALQELGLSAAELVALSPEEQYDRITAALQGVSNGSDKARLAQGIFTEAGLKMLPMLEAGGTAIKDTDKRLRALGVTLTREGAAGVEIMNDALGELQLVNQAATNQLAVAFAPIVSGLATELSNAAVATGGFAKYTALLADVAQTAGVVLAKVGDGGLVITKGMRGAIIAVLEVVLKIVRGIVKAFEWMVNKVIDALNSMVSVYNAAAKRVWGLSEIALFDPFNLSSTGKKLDGLVDAAKETRIEMQGEFGKLLDNPLPSDKVSAWFARVRDEGAKQAAAVAENSRNRTAGVAQPDAPDDDVPTGASGPVNVFSKVAADMGTLWDNVTNGISSVADGMRNAIGGALQGLMNKTMSWGDALRNIAGGFVSSMGTAISDVAARWVIQQAADFAVAQGWSLAKIGLHASEESAKTALTAGGAGARGAIATGETINEGVQAGIRVGIRAGEEGTKTGTTLVGSLARGAIRVGETIFELAQVGIRVVAWIAGEAAKTGATLLGAAMRLPIIIAESIAYVFQAAVGAMSALASIPFIGPVLAVAAAGAMIAGGMKLVSNIGGFNEGGFTPGGVHQIAGAVHGGEWVAPAWQVRDPEFAPLIAYLEGARRGYSVGGPVDYNFPPPAAATAQPAAQNRFNIGLFNDPAALQRWAQSQEGETVIMDVLRRNRHEFQA